MSSYFYFFRPFTKFQNAVKVSNPYRVSNLIKHSENFYAPGRTVQDANKKTEINFANFLKRKSAIPDYLFKNNILREEKSKIIWI